MNATIDEATAVQAMWSDELADQVSALVSTLEALLLQVYETQEEALLSPEARQLDDARELLFWVRGGQRPAFVTVN